MIVRHQHYHRLDYHLVFVTKFREGSLTRKVLARFHDLCQKKAEELGFLVHISNGYQDHVHLLISLKPVHQLSEIIRQIKGFTSREIKGLRWQRGYGAFTVDKRSFDIIFRYIKNQEEHHSSNLPDSLDLAS